VVTMVRNSAVELPASLGSEIGPRENTRPGMHDEPEAELVAEDVLVEEVSIDGMCGVY
jgi:mycofactocin precursor